MAAQANNRYALFGAQDENRSPLNSPPLDPNKNPFLNQIGDESAPWQEVKKRGNYSAQLLPRPAAKAAITKAQYRIPTHPAGDEFGRVRGFSCSTVESSEKAYDPHENWCGICSLKFGNKSALLSHIKQSPEHQHYCNLCKRVFKDRNGLKNHLENSQGHDVSCNLCFSAFKDEWGLKNHFENNYHAGHGFACLTCLKGFRSHIELDRHLQTAAKHTWCATCHRRFRTQDERDEHWEKTASKNIE